MQQMYIIGRGGDFWFSDTKKLPGDTVMTTVYVQNNAPQMETLQRIAENLPDTETLEVMVRSALSRPRPLITEVPQEQRFIRRHVNRGSCTYVVTLPVP